AFSHGVQSGDVDATSGMVWTRVDRPARILMEYATTESFADPVRLPPLEALPATDLTAKRLLSWLPADQEIFYRMVAADLAETSLLSEPITGRLRTAPAGRRPVRFAWSGDTAGQGWGIDEVGMKTYAAIAGHAPDFLLHSGDAIYADGPMVDTVELGDGGTWRNIVLTDAKRKVAETLDEFRGQWKYNLQDRHVQALNARVPTFVQWDDHEVLNNWSPGKDLSDDARYTEKSVTRLAARAARAFHEMTPIRPNPAEPNRVYRRIAYGPLLDVFFLDLRSYRGRNYLTSAQDEPGSRHILGERQLAWMKRALSASRATWKVIACDLPLGLVSWEDVAGGRAAEAFANGEGGPPRGRELEIADLLRHIQRAGITNIVWLTADVHYTAAHHYDPSRARFRDFDPFWEFVSGPLHAGSFAQKELDPTFGPEVRFVKAPPPGLGASVPPSAGWQFFGLVDIDGEARLTVRLMDRANTELWRVTLDPAPAA
ncbi:MAG TPA: alkaline phosphatase D family protein, partial [Candidatus Limnocylindrales bacterium]|nr:alkaline phosphatase D family protein [Candidatus Limnocylindrales bacterium]